MIATQKDIYNNCILNYDSKQPFLNGLLIGCDLEENKKRLLESKYDLK